jgi:Flp pilus assembly protein TadG
MGLMSKAWRANIFHRQTGSIVVETALSMFAFLLVFFGIAEAGRLLEVQNMLTNAAREGTRLGVTPQAGTMGTSSADYLPNDAAIRTEVHKYLASGGVTVPDGDIVINRSDPATPPYFTTVTITHHYSLMTGLFQDPGITLKASSSMRNETSQ